MPAQENHLRRVAGGLRRVGECGHAVVSAIPADPNTGSPRHIEEQALRASNDGGVERARLLHEPNGDAQLILANMTIMLGGVADLLDAASFRGDTVTWPGMANAVRPVLEGAGLASWLLDPNTDADERARRYLKWLFADLHQRRQLLDEFRVPNAEIDAAERELDGDESALVKRVRAARWDARPRKMRPTGEIERAALLNGGKAEWMPTLSALVRRIVPRTSVYRLLSISTHGSRVALHQGYEVLGELDDGQAEVVFTGFSLEPGTLIRIALIAINESCGKLAAWNGLGIDELLRAGRDLALLLPGDPTDST